MSQYGRISGGVLRANIEINENNLITYIKIVK